MLTTIHPKLPMRDKPITRDFYVNQLGFTEFGATEFPDYLMVRKEGVELHFFLYAGLNPKKNYGQIYIRTDAVDALYRQWLNEGVRIHPNGALETKPWGQREFSLLDPDHNLLTFGQAA